MKAGVPCTKPYQRKSSYGPDSKGPQSQACYGRRCWECGRAVSGRKDPKKFTPDHQPPLKVAWEMGGCHQPDPPGTAFEEWAQSTAAVLPHCRACSGPGRGSQMNVMSQLTPEEIRSFSPTLYRRIMDWGRALVRARRWI